MKERRVAVAATIADIARGGQLDLVHASCSRAEMGMMRKQQPGATGPQAQGPAQRELRSHRLVGAWSQYPHCGVGRGL